MGVKDIFSLFKHDLNITSGIGGNKESVDHSFSTLHMNSGTVCFICGNTASYKLIPKHDKYNTAEIQDRGFVCNYCVQNNSNINKSHYGLRDINKP